MDLIFVIPRCAIAHRGCADRTRVYPSSAISLSKSATADLDAQARNPHSRLWLWIPGSRFARPGMTEQLSFALAPTTPAPAPSAFPASAGFAARGWRRQSRVQPLAEAFAHRPVWPAPRPTAAPARERAWMPAALLHQCAAAPLSASAPKARGLRH